MEDLTESPELDPDATKARLWAQEWCRIALQLVAKGENLIDEDWMAEWFAKLIEVGRIAERMKAKPDHDWERLNELEREFGIIEPDPPT